MKTNRNPKLLRSLAAVVGGFALFTGPLQAATFQYSSGDLVLAFRSDNSANDYAVNVGKVANFTNVPPGTTFAITNLSPSQLSSAFSSYNRLKWSVAAANLADNQVPGYIENTFWVTSPRSANNTQTAPWQRRSPALQGNTASQIDAVGANAKTAAGTVAVPAGPNNTETGVVVPDNLPYNANVGQPIGNGNYGSFQGSVETITPTNFVANPNNIARSDFYELVPGSGPGRWLGYFELKANGTLSFSTLPPPPTITSITRTGNVATVTFTARSNVTYRLRTTGEAGLNTPVSTWALGATVVSTGSVATLTDTNTAAIRFFAVEAQ